ncbi:MAG: guanylate kinase [Bacteroidota bacterium]
MTGKLIIFSAPSGSGKTSIVRNLLKRISSLEFSVSATSRKPRKGEIHGKDYYFVSPDEFREKIENNEFVEWEEVYEDIYYGTLKSELERIFSSGNHVIFDVDVVGGLNIKRQFPDTSLAVFITVPSFEELEKRLRKRSTESDESLQKRLSKAKKELIRADCFDIQIMNDYLENATDEAERAVREFVEN